jgi:hypothetical protein
MSVENIKRSSHIKGYKITVEVRNPYPYYVDVIDSEPYYVDVIDSEIDAVFEHIEQTLEVFSDIRKYTKEVSE